MGNATKFARSFIGTAVRGYRENAGLTVVRAAAELMMSASKISRIETGQASIQSRDIMDFGRLYNIDHDELENLHALSLASRGPRQGILGVVSNMFAYVSALASSTEIWTSNLSALPSLLWTKNYAARENPIYAREWENIFATITRGSRPDVTAVFKESVLRFDGSYEEGNRDLMTDQLQHLLELSRLPNVSIRIIPEERSHGDASPVVEVTRCLISEPSLSDGSEIGWLEWWNADTALMLRVSGDEDDEYSIAKKSLPHRESFEIIQRAAWRFSD